MTAIRKTYMAAFVALLLAVSAGAMASAASASCPSTGCGYPSISRAQTFALENKVHGQCGGGSTYWLCDNGSGELSWIAICNDKRGEHSLDCQQVGWSEVSLTLAGRFCTVWSYHTQSDGIWIRYETSTGNLSFHRDPSPSKSCN